LRFRFADDRAGCWVRLRDRGPLFENRAPVEAMIESGIPAMRDVRRHVDALHDGRWPIELASLVRHIAQDRTFRPVSITASSIRRPGTPAAPA
jgi:hypothetical protein